VQGGGRGFRNAHASIFAKASVFAKATPDETLDRSLRFGDAAARHPYQGGGGVLLMAEPEAHQEDHETTDIRTIDQGGLAGEAMLEEDGAGDLQDHPEVPEVKGQRSVVRGQFSEPKHSTFNIQRREF
jgi:hypothetical protein